MASRAMAEHNTWAERQWEIYNDRQAERAPHTKDIDLHIEDMTPPIDWDKYKREWEAKSETGN